MLLIDTQFYFPLVPVTLVSIFSEARALTMRSLLEGLGCVVHLHRPGTPGDFLKVVAQGPGAPPYLIIESHGTPDGLYFGDFDPRIDTSMLRDGSLPPEAIREHVRLPGCVILNTSCYAGSPAMAEAFLKGGAQAYLGGRTAHGVPMNLFAANFVYAMLGAKRTPREAWRWAAAALGYPKVRVAEVSFFDSNGEDRLSEKALPGS